MKDVHGLNVVITGSSEGVGREIALAFARESAHLVLVNRKEAEETKREIEKVGGRAESLLCDIRLEEQVRAMASEASQILDGRIDVLINNAGFNGKAHLVQDMVLSDWKYVLDVNLTGTMLVTREILPYMKARRSGIIVNMASNVARRGLPFRADYVCSKWALLGLTQTLALELADQGIRVNAVCPGPIEGERIQQILEMHATAEGVSVDEMRRKWQDVPMKRFVRPQEVASVVRFLCSQDSSAMTGQALNITAGFIMT